MDSSLSILHYFIAVFTLLKITPCARALDVDALRGALTDAEVVAVFRDDPGYVNASSAYNLRYDISPIVIAYPSTPQQVSAVVQAGGAQKLAVTARSGGHSYIAAGLGGKDGALVVDMGSFNETSVNETDNTANVGAGVLLGDLALALNEYGRALPHGRCPTVGDLPRINKPPPPPPPSRMWGMLLDHIVSATVVLSDGSIVTASELENADLFWAIRGAGPSFGIVIEFVFATELIPLGGTTFRYGWNLTAVDAIHALATFQDFVESDIPPAFGAQLNFNKSTVVGYVNMEYFGEHWGHPTTLDETNERFLDKLPPPDSVDSFCGDWIAVLNASAWGDLNTSATPPQHSTFYIKSLMVPEAEGLSPTAVGAFVQYLTDERSVTSDLSWFVEIELYGGSGSAINTVGTDKTAFPHRDKVFTMQLAALSPNDRPPYPDDGFSFLDDLVNAVIESEPSGWPYGAYANYADARLQNWRTLYFGDNYQELSRMKTLYDPTNIFRSPLSVEMDIL
ncbi:FAD-binding domain-containing protein [Schizophyllum commune H4-8]|nr:FAD-binding domain-containing protein [Schizophyllum commune H4-8]KAI5889678.1 FAD-binding domain-containing protein [Schizophyllum commune H4-8]